MYLNDESSSKKGKRKMRNEPLGIHEITNLFNFNDTNFSHVQQILNNAAPKKPFSFMSLLTEYDADNIDHYININSQRAQMDQIIAFQCENIKQRMGQQVEEVHRGVEKRAAKRLERRESELLARKAQLELMLENYKAQAERMHIRVRTLKSALTERLEEANAVRFYPEDAESSIVDPRRVEPITVECKACERMMATVMMWPCRHVCVCRRCEGSTHVCPVCGVVKNNSMEVYLEH